MESQTTSRNPHHVFWKSQNMGWEIKPRAENNIGGASNTTLSKDSGSTTIKNTTGSETAPRQKPEEALSNQAREIETISRPSLRTLSLAFFPSSTNVMSKPSCSN